MKLKKKKRIKDSWIKLVLLVSWMDWWPPAHNQQAAAYPPCGRERKGKVNHSTTTKPTHLFLCSPQVKAANEEWRAYRASWLAWRTACLSSSSSAANFISFSVAVGEDKLRYSISLQSHLFISLLNQTSWWKRKRIKLVCLFVFSFVAEHWRVPRP